MISKRVREALAPTDPAIIEVAAGGERLVARMRVVFWGAIWTIPFFTLLTLRDAPPEVFISFVASSFALLISVAFVIAVRRYRRVASIAFATTFFDITLVTITLAAIALAGRPAVAVNSHVIWPVYLLAILATSFRFDFRVCALAGFVSVTEYVLLVWWITTRWPPGSLLQPADGYGDVSWPIQVARLLLQLVATSLAAGIVHQGRQLAHVSGKDRLTGLGNRSLFDETLDVELARADRARQPLSLAFLDIDHFKRFNDTWGHEAGDAALRAVAIVLTNECRAGDRAFRWGGEELTVILPETNAEGAAAQLERIRAALRALPLPSAPPDVHVTISAGIAACPRDGWTADALIAAADRRLLLAKSRGRDRVEWSESELPIVRAS